MIRNFRWLNVMILVVAISCGKSLPEISGVDLTSWKKDHQGCNGARKSMEDALQAQKNKLLGLSEMEIIELLGRPDENELFKRNQKFYHYFLEPSVNCAEPAH
ncbi:MAG TPA: hypothetical protein VFW11_16170, partial [Cyclobacteriaceae bacterium]|nr:hypothetical protein [Cyclobacteriaceae bacterium]